jgi:hypothetical protein
MLFAMLITLTIIAVLLVYICNYLLRIVTHMSELVTIARYWEKDYLERKR